MILFQNGKCVNTEGDYYCLCNPHFIPSPDKKFCIGKCYFLLPSFQTWLQRYVTSWTSLQMVESAVVTRIWVRRESVPIDCRCSCQIGTAVVGSTWAERGEIFVRRARPEELVRYAYVFVPKNHFLIYQPPGNAAFLIQILTILQSSCSLLFK